MDRKAETSGHISSPFFVDEPRVQAGVVGILLPPHLNGRELSSCVLRSFGARGRAEPAIDTSRAFRMRSRASIVTASAPALVVRRSEDDR